MINKEKVSKILADMQEAERKKQEAIQKEVDDFLEGRLEYYVAMVMNGDIFGQEELINNLFNDGCQHCRIVAIEIEKSLEDYDYYTWHLCGFNSMYAHIEKIGIYSEWLSEKVIKRQIELGLRQDEDKEEKEEPVKEESKNGIVYYIAITVITAITLLMITCHH